VGFMSVDCFLSTDFLWADFLSIFSLIAGGKV
jgi:hypothetical protein